MLRLIVIHVITSSFLKLKSPMSLLERKHKPTAEECTTMSRRRANVQLGTRTQ